MIEQDRGGFRPREEFIAAVVRPDRLQEPVEELVAEHDRAVSESYRLTPGVRSALDAAREAGWSFAVVTNGPVQRQQTKITATGLDNLADADLHLRGGGCAQAGRRDVRAGGAARGHHPRRRVDDR